MTWHSAGVQVASTADPAKPSQAAEWRPRPLPLVATEDPALSIGTEKAVLWSYPIVRDGLIYVVDLRNGLYVLRYRGPYADELRCRDFLEGNSNLGRAVPLCGLRVRVALRYRRGPRGCARRGVRARVRGADAHRIRRPPAAGARPAADAPERGPHDGRRHHGGDREAAAAVRPVTDLPHVGLYRRWTATALVAGPALFLVDNLLHPKEYARGNEAEQVAEIAANADRWQAAHVLGLVALVVITGAILGLAFLVRRRQPRLGLVAGALGVAGMVGAGAVMAIDGYTWGIVGAAATDPDVGARAAAAVLEDVQESGWSVAYYLLPAGFIAGLGALGIGAARQGAVPPLAGWTLAAAALITGSETVIVSNAYFIAGAIVLLAGGAATAAAVFRMTDADFAAGGAP